MKSHDFGGIATSTDKSRLEAEHGAIEGDSLLENYHALEKSTKKEYQIFRAAKTALFCGIGIWVLGGSW